MKVNLLINHVAVLVEELTSILMSLLMLGSHIKKFLQQMYQGLQCLV